MYRVNEKLISPPLNPKKREQMVSELRKSVVSDDVIAAIFSFVEAEKIPLDVKKIHSAIFKLKQRYPEMFKQFVFSRNDYYPYSVLLERVLFRLQNVDLINTVNPDFKICIISNESKDYIKKNILPLFEQEDRKKLQKMGEDFEKIVS